jgi:uncharacterized protein YukE
MSDTSKAQGFDHRSEQLSSTLQLLKQELWAMHERVGGERFTSSSDQHAIFVRMGEIAQAIEQLKSVKHVVSDIANVSRREEND